MRGTECSQDRRRDRGDRVGWHRSALTQQLAQGAALDEFHHQECVVAVRALVVHRDQAGVLQPGNRPGLELQAGKELWVGRETRVHDLDRHRTIEAQIHAQVHTRHPPAGDQRIDPIATLDQDAEQHVGRGVHQLGPFSAGRDTNNESTLARECREKITEHVWRPRPER